MVDNQCTCGSVSRWSLVVVVWQSLSPMATVISKAVITNNQVGEPVSYLESRLISEVTSQVLRRLIGQMSAISTLRLFLTGSRGEYLRVVGIHSDG